jgi:3-oxoacyl-[acyl-carrier-protein] synthase-3
VWGAEGDKWETIAQRESWIEVKDSWTQVEEEHIDFPAILMKGQSVFRWAVWGMAPVAQAAIDKAGITSNDLDAFIPHQANMRITDAMIKQLKLPDRVAVARDIAETGNTSAASVPLATERMLREGQVKSGGLALQIGFGAGLVYAAQVVVLP